MGKLLVTITEIKNVDNLNLVSFDFFGTKLVMMSLELPKNVIVGAKVLLNIKSTSLTIGKEIGGELSILNRLDASIKSIEIGELLSSITLSVANTLFETIVTNEALDRLDLQTNEKVAIYIKESEISITEVLDD